jgi:hypothetical protein
MVPKTPKESDEMRPFGSVQTMHIKTLLTMSDTQQTPSTTPIAQTTQQVEDTAAQTLESGEVCVSEHPLSSVTTAFAGGLVIGALIGWAIAQAHHHSYREACREVARDWMQRLHLD